MSKAEKQSIGREDVSSVAGVVNEQIGDASTGGTASAPAAAITGFDPSRIVVKKNVTLPLLKVQPERPYYVRITSSIYQAEKLKNHERLTEKQKAMEPPQLAEIVNLETGEKMLMIFTAVLKSSLEDSYADAAYVGKHFMIIKHEKATGKAYSTWTISEIELQQ